MKFRHVNHCASHGATLAIGTALLLSACGGGGNDSTTQDAARQPTALVAAITADESSSTSSSSENSSQASSEETSATSSSSSAGTGNDSPTLASCFSPMPGKQFTLETHQETSYSSPSTTYGTNSISTGTYLGKDVIVESASSTTGTSAIYSTYSPTAIEVLGEVSQYVSGTVSRTTTYTFSGYVIDLTKKIGETQTINMTQTTDTGATSKSTVNLTWVGYEDISIAGTLINTCKLTLIPPASKYYAISFIAWAAPGYGFNSGIKVYNEILYKLTTDYSHSTTVQTSPL